MTDILAGNTDPEQNPFWGKFDAAPTRTATRRPAAFKTGTNNDAKDLDRVRLRRAARRRRPRQPASTRWSRRCGPATPTAPSCRRRTTRSSRSTSPRRMWQGFMDEATKSWPIKDFDRPGGLVKADVDAWSGGKPTQFTTKTVKEIFIEGTVPGDDTIHVGMHGHHRSPTGTTTCGTRAAPACPRRRASSTSRHVEADQPDWRAANNDWIARAKQGVGVEGGPDPERQDRDQLLLQPLLHTLRQELGRAVPARARLRPGCHRRRRSCASLPIPTTDPFGSPFLVCPSPSPSASPSPSPSDNAGRDDHARADNHSGADSCRQLTRHHPPTDTPKPTKSRHRRLRRAALACRLPTPPAAPAGARRHTLGP